MAEDFGAGVSRTLSAIWRQFGPVVFQQGKPPLDSEVNLMGQVEMERVAQAIRTMVPSGFFTDPTRALNDYRFDPQWSNLFVLGNPRGDNPNHVHDADERNPVVWANINGWIIPVAGTHIDVAEGIENIIRLYPPPASDSRIDFVFLEAWTTLVAPNPSTANKPDASHLWKFGNVQYGGTNITDDLEDPAVRFETTERVQIQYRLRVFGQGVGLGSGVSLDVYPDGLDDPNILGQATASAPVGGLTFDNMREELGDPSLWRAGDGDPLNDLGTTDGYTYAIPICALFRRNSGVYQSVADAGTANQNGAFLRTPSTQTLPDPLEGARELLTATLGQDLAYDDENLDVDITNLNGSGLEDTALVPGSTFLVIGDEVIGFDSVDVGNERIHIPIGGRGRYASNATGHAVGETVSFFNWRPDGLYADQIADTDILDLRRTINTGDWDYQRLLNHNIAALVRGDLRTAWKTSGTGTTEGVSVHEVDYLQADGSVATPNGTEALDGPDGVREVWSDAAAMQPDVTLLLNDQTPLTNGFTSSDQFDTLVEWGVGPDFKPVGFMNLGGVFSAQGWTNGSSIFLHIGGENGGEGARGTFRDGSDREVRFVTPKEYFRNPSPDIAKGNQYPVTVRLLDQKAMEPVPHEGIVNDDWHPGPLYPWDGRNFERPFIVLGQILASTLKDDVLVSGLSTSATPLTGTVVLPIKSSQVVGTGTAFTTELNPGDYIIISGEGARMVRSIEDDLNLTVAMPGVTGTPGVTISKIDYLTLDVGIDFDTDGIYFSKDANGNFNNDPSVLVSPLWQGQRTLYGMLTGEGTDRTGASSEVYVVLYGDPDSLGNNGAFKVVGAGDTAGYTTFRGGSSTEIVLQPLSTEFTGLDPATGNTVTVEFRSQDHNAEEGGSFADSSPDLCIVLTDIGGGDTTPWDRANLGFDLSLWENLGNFPPLDATGNPRTLISSKALLAPTLLYHPGRGGMARVADDVVRVSLRDADSTYLRQSKVTVDPTFPNAPDDETFYDTSHVQLWNRLPALGWHAPEAPDYGGNIVGFTEQDREHELFFDKGSKTLLFRPFRDRQMTLHGLSFTAGTGESEFAPTDSMIGEYTYPDTTPKDSLQLFTNTGAASSGKKMGIAVPREFMPRFGRQDIPYHVDTAAGTGTFLDGINHLFRDSTDVTEPVFSIIGGQDNLTAGNEVTSMYFRTDSPHLYGHSGTVVTPFGNQGFYEARKTTAINAALPFAQEIIDALREVSSSDLGKGLKGVQLPPYLGIARLYGVYAAADFDAKGGATFELDRITPLADPAPNLLRTDQDQQTLFILQDGAKDLTTFDGDHTYIVPSEVIDVTKALTYTPGQTFDDFEFVIVCVVFGFARDWINGNNYVLARAHDGKGDPISDGDDPELEGVHMVIPAPAAYQDAMFVAHNRTVYQGDPYMTRHQSTRVISDYEYRYGRPEVANLYELRDPIQQFKADGTFVPEVPNGRAFEVLAAVDFYTTLGTGSIGGDLLPGTFLDVGFMENTSESSTRIPESASATPWTIRTRAFTEGQRNNPSRAFVDLEILDLDLLAPTAGPPMEQVVLRFDLLNDTSVDIYAAGSALHKVNLEGTGIPSEDIFVLDVDSSTQILTDAVTITFPLPFNCVPNAGAQTQFVTLTTDLAALTDVNKDRVLGERVTAFGESNDYGAIVYETWIPSSGVIRIRGTYTLSALAFEQLPTGNSKTFAPVFAASIPAHSTSTVGPLTFNGMTPLTPVVVGGSGTLPDGIILTVVAGTDDVTIKAHNTTDGAVAVGSKTVRVVALGDADSIPLPTITVSNEPFKLTLLKKAGTIDQTIRNLIDVVNINPSLAGAVRARRSLTSTVRFEADPTGARGNDLRLSVRNVERSNIAPYPETPSSTPVQEVLNVIVPQGNNRLLGANNTSAYFFGGVDEPVNGGDGTTQLRLTGMTERLPLGILLQDSDFLGENPLGDTASAMNSNPAGLRPLQTVLPLTTGGEEYSRFLGAPGDLIGMGDGAILEYTPYNETTAPTGATTLRIYRGGGSVFVLSGLNPGGPVDWVSETFSAPLKPVLKGGALVCRALLVRNFYEEPFDTPFTVTEGDEVQMVVITHGVLGDGHTQAEGIELSGIISPSGYGKGFAASDRYRIEGRPMFKGFSRVTPDPEGVVLAPVPDTEG
jgi:hypothetical protein